MSRLIERTTGVSARIADLVLRLLPKNTSDALRWITRGYDEEDDEQEVFHGAGFASRPAAGSNAEAIAVAVNGFDHHVIIATRDADTLRRVVEALGLGEGEAIVFSSGTAVKCSASKIVAKSLEGAAVSLALKSELVAVQARVDTIEQRLIAHLHPTTTAGLPTGAGYAPPAIAPPILPTSPVSINGTQVFEAE